MNDKHNEYLVDQEIPVKKKPIAHYACRMPLNGFTRVKEVICGIQYAGGKKKNMIINLLQWQDMYNIQCTWYIALHTF